MSIVWSSADTADPEKLILHWCGRIRAWHRRRRAEQIQRKFGGTWMDDWRRVVASPVIEKKAATKALI